MYLIIHEFEKEDHTQLEYFYTESVDASSVSLRQRGAMVIKKYGQENAGLSEYKDTLAIWWMEDQRKYRIILFRQPLQRWVERNV